MLEPILVPLLPIDLYALHVVTVLPLTIRCYSDRGVPVDSHIDVLKPWAFNQIHWLRCYRVQPNHLPDQPAVQRPSIAVARHTVWRIVEELICKRTGSLNALVLLVEIVVKIRRCKVRLITLMKSAKS